MTYLLDTNTCIRYLNERSPALSNRLRQTPESEIVVCSVVKAELFTGAMKSRQPDSTLRKQLAFIERFVSFPFDDVATLTFARIRAALELAGQPIGPNDTMIAAIALTHGLTLVTANLREFARVPGLEMENWESI